MRRIRVLLLAKLVVEVGMGAILFLLAYAAIAWGEPRERTLSDFRFEEHERRLRDIETTRPHNITRLNVVEATVKSNGGRIDRLENAAIAFMVGGGTLLGGSGVLTWRVYKKVNGK